MCIVRAGLQGDCPCSPCVPCSGVLEWEAAADAHCSAATLLRCSEWAAACGGAECLGVLVHAVRHYLLAVCLAMHAMISLVVLALEAVVASRCCGAV